MIDSSASSAQIDPTAELEAGVEIGRDVAIGHGTVVRSGVRIGNESRIGRDVVIDRGVQLGDRVRVDDRALLYEGASVEDGVFIGPGAIITNDRFPRAVTSTGELPAPDDLTVTPVAIRHGASIGAGAVVVAGTEVGRFAMVGAGAVVTRNVGGHALVAGSPARRLGWVCACGMRLLDSSGHPAHAQPERYALDRELICPSCDRRYVYVPDAESLEETTASNLAPHQGAPA